MLLAVQLRRTVDIAQRVLGTRQCHMRDHCFAGADLCCGRPMCMLLSFVMRALWRGCTSTVESPESQRSSHSRSSFPDRRELSDSFRQAQRTQEGQSIAVSQKHHVGLQAMAGGEFIGNATSGCHHAGKQSAVFLVNRDPIAQMHSFTGDPNCVSVVARGTECLKGTDRLMPC